MSDSHEINVFANALFKMGIELKKLENFKSDFIGFIEVIETPSEFKKLLLSPRITKGEKKTFIKKVFGSKISEEFLAFIVTILLKRYQGQVERIYKQFQNLVDKHENISRVKVISVSKLGKKTLDNITKILSDKYKTNIILTEVQDESILGGLIIIMNDVKIDMSVLHSLDTLKSKILTANVGGSVS